MSYVTVAELRDALGIGALYNDDTVQSCIDAAEDVILPMLTQHTLPVVAKKLENNVVTVTTSIPVTFVVGETVTSYLAAPFSGAVVLTAVTPYTMSWAKTNPDVSARYQIPAGVIGTKVNWTGVQPVHQAILMTAADVWQARTASNGQGVGVDFAPAPFRMGHSLLTRVKGLLAPYMSIGSMIG
jgi:hypothetical protein